MVMVRFNNGLLDLCHFSNCHYNSKSLYSQRIPKLLFCFCSVMGTIKFYPKEETWEQLPCLLIEGICPEHSFVQSRNEDKMTNKIIPVVTPWKTYMFIV